MLGIKQSRSLLFNKCFSGKWSFHSWSTVTMNSWLFCFNLDSTLLVQKYCIKSFYNLSRTFYTRINIPLCDFSIFQSFTLVKYPCFILTPVKLFHDGGPYYIETKLLICSTNQWTGFYMTRTSVVKELTHFLSVLRFCSPLQNTRKTKVFWRFQGI